jgi:hypothetical protein
MKPHFKTWSIAAATIVALSVGMAAQDTTSPDHKPKHKKYRLFDIGTLRGGKEL